MTSTPSYIADVDIEPLTIMHIASAHVRNGGFHQTIQVLDLSHTGTMQADTGVLQILTLVVLFLLHIVILTSQTSGTLPF